MRLSYFFSKKECILAILEGLIFKIFRPVGPNHGAASLVTEPQPPQSQKCSYGPGNGQQVQQKKYCSHYELTKQMFTQ